jgi:choline-sulfatase
MNETLPNVIVFLSDDHAQWASGAYGNHEIRTPAIDSLARNGVKFENAFTPIPVCSPARASFWTGKLPSQHGIHDYLADSDPEVAAIPWLRDSITLAERYQAAGYTTAMVGKWHAGTHNRHEAGFDYWFSQFGPPTTPTEFSAQIDGPPALPEGQFDRHAITDHAINFLRRRDQARPFFLFVGHFATHSPWTGHPERLVEQYRGATFDDIPTDSAYRYGRPTAEALYASRETPRETTAQYYAAVSLIDEQLGRVMDEVEAQGLEQNTAIIYSADHGINAGHHGLWGKGNATYPYNMLEESIRIPLIISAPGHIFSRQVRAEAVTLCDLHETLLEIAGIVPERDTASVAGRSLLSLCRAESSEMWADALFGEYGDLRMIRTRTHKLVRRYGPTPGELYDLIADPRETTNIINHEAMTTLVNALDAQLETYFERFENPAYSGLRVANLPRHNRDEAWRDDGSTQLTASADWLHNSLTYSPANPSATMNGKTL